MKAILAKLFQHHTLNKNEAYNILIKISEGAFNEFHIASFLTIFQMRTITVEELCGFRNALLDLCIQINLKDFDAIDLCGTGGDGKNTFNISTLCAFVVSGAGFKVAKHGNYGVSSACGSSNVMEYLGYKFINNTSILKTQLDKYNICFLHAPLFHPAMKNVAPIRKSLAFKTFFNMLGPIVNPAKLNKQSTGVFSLQLARLYNYLFQNQKNKKYNIIFSLDGYDEISLTGNFKIISESEEKLYSPEKLGFGKHNQESLFGGSTVKEAAQIFINILEGKGTIAQNEAIFANAGFAIKCANESDNIYDCIELAKESLLSGNALKVLKNVIA